MINQKAEAMIYKRQNQRASLKAKNTIRRGGTNMR